MRRILLWAVPLLVAAIVVAPMVVFAMDGASGGTVARNVTVDGVPVSGLSAEELRAQVEDLADRLGTEPVPVVVDGTTVALDPAEVGTAIDVDGIVTEALAARRTGSLVGDFIAWFRAFQEPIDVPVRVSVDPERFTAVLDGWTAEILDEPAAEGGIVVEGGAVRAEYPKAGSRVDPERSRPLVEEAIADPHRSPVVLPVGSLSPKLTPADVDAALDRAKAMTARHLTLRSGDVEYVLTPGELASALVDEVVGDPPRLEVRFDRDRLADLVAPVVPRVETPPVDASFTFDEEAQRIDIVPSRNGLTIDLDRLPAVVEQAALAGDDAEVPLAATVEPAFTTADAEAMGPITKVSEFTTYHPCCQSRNINIDLLADEIDGAIVWPGETFSINEYAGRRTTAEGYVRAGAIIDGRVQCCDSIINVGGGTSQFATTFYNAVFFGCYEDVEHQPHSLYFSRYPYGREATLGWPKPDVIFRNDTDAIVYIDTSHTATSVTVAFWGNNGGRVCIAESKGRGRVTTTRVITYPDGTVKREDFVWTYRAKPKPAPTTTTLPPSTTTTLPGTTTTVPGTTTTAPPSTTTTTTTTTTTAPPSTTTTTTVPP